MKRPILMVVAAVMVAMVGCGEASQKADVVISSTSSSAPATVPTTAALPTAAPQTAVSETAPVRPTVIDEIVDRGAIGEAMWSLTARRDTNGLVCAQLQLEDGNEGQVCNAPSEQDFNGDDVLRYSLVGDRDAFLLAVASSGVARVRVELISGEVVERAAVPASFTSARFVALPLPRQPVIRTIQALGSSGEVLTSFAINP